MNISLKQLLDELHESFEPEDDLTEDNVTSNLDGGLGQPQTPSAFRKSVKEPDDDSYSEDVEETDLFFKKFESIQNRINAKVEALNKNHGNIIKEVNYKDYKNDDSKTERQKINSNILEINKKLREVEQMVNHAKRLKVETGAGSDVFWKGTISSFLKIKERLNRLSNKIVEMN